MYPNPNPTAALDETAFPSGQLPTFQLGQVDESLKLICQDTLVITLETLTSILKCVGTLVCPFQNVLTAVVGIFKDCSVILVTVLHRKITHENQVNLLCALEKL